MKYYKFLTIIAVLLISFSCQVTEPTTSRTVQPLDEGIQTSSNPIVYALPRTVLKIDVTANKVTKKRGPYYRYGKRYLGIEEGIENDHTEWILSDVNISSYQEIDPDQYYLINSTGTVYSSYLQMTRLGLVLTSNPDMYRTFVPVQKPARETGDIVFFSDKSVKKSLTVSSDTTYRLIESDTGFVRVPHVELKSILKTDNEKAEEAANFIIKIRKRRFKLLSGQYDVFPEGVALEYAVKELTRLENEYLALFVGKTIVQKKKKSFEFIPEKKHDESSTVLFRFSQDNGIVPENDLTGRPINLKIEGLNDPEQFAQMENQDESSRRSDLVYRVPNPCNIEIIDGKIQITKKKLLVYQLGALLRLPENLYITPEN